MTATELIRNAMEALENLPCGGIGEDGLSLPALETSPESVPDSIYFHGQWAWRRLEQALQALEKQK